MQYISQFAVLFLEEIKGLILFSSLTSLFFSIMDSSGGFLGGFAHTFSEKCRQFEDAFLSSFQRHTGQKNFA